MQEVASTVREWGARGWRSAFVRIIDAQGFGGSCQEELFAMNELGTTVGGLLAGTVDDTLLASAKAVLAGSADAGLRRFVGHVHGESAVRAGLACGGSAEVLVQAVDEVPVQFWAALADQMPVALATVIEGRWASGRALAVTGDELVWGSLGDMATDQAVASAAAGLLAQDVAAIRRVETERGTVLIEALVPVPRLVVVGGGSLADALVAQAALLGWPARVVADIEEAEAALAWAAKSGAGTAPSP